MPAPRKWSWRISPPSRKIPPRISVRPARYFLRKTRAPALSRPFFFFGNLTETRRHGGGGVATAVLCRLGVARECRKMNANRKAQGRGGSPSGPKTQARKRRIPQTKSSRRAAGTQRRELLKHLEFWQAERHPLVRLSENMMICGTDPSLAIASCSADLPGLPFNRKVHFEIRHDLFLAVFR